MQSSISNPLRLGLRQERVIPPQCLVIFGASGDLTHRKLIPALFELFLQRRLPSEFAIVGCARRPWSDEEFKENLSIFLNYPYQKNHQAYMPIEWLNFSFYCKKMLLDQDFGKLNNLQQKVGIPQFENVL